VVVFCQSCIADGEGSSGFSVGRHSKVTETYIRSTVKRRLLAAVLCHWKTVGTVMCTINFLTFALHMCSRIIIFIFRITVEHSKQVYLGLSIFRNIIYY